MIEKGDCRYMRLAEEGIERHVADLESAAPGGGQPRIPASAAFFDQGDGGIQRFPFDRVGRQILAAPFGVVGQIARTLLHHGVEQQKGDNRRGGIVPALR